MPARSMSMSSCPPTRSPRWAHPPTRRTTTTRTTLIGRFIDKLLTECQDARLTQACVLVNNATETRWGQALLGMSSAVCFLRGRVRYLNADGMPVGSPLQGQVVVWLDEHGKVDRFRDEFERFGVVL